MNAINVCARLVVTGACLLTAACATVEQQRAEAVSVSRVVSAIKDDMREAHTYLKWARAQKAQTDICKGMVNFDLGIVSVELTTLTTKSKSGNVGATVPVGHVTISPSLTASQDLTNTQTIRFVLSAGVDLMQEEDKVPKMDPAEELDPANFPITAGLRTLRNGLLSTSDKGPCIVVGPAVADEKSAKAYEGTLVYSFVVDAKTVRDTKLGFLIFAAGASSTDRSQALNKVTVTFAPVRGSTAFVPKSPDGFPVPRDQIM